MRPVVNLNPSFLFSIELNCKYQERSLTLHWLVHLISYIMKKENRTIEEVENILNKESGLFGITGKYSDHRDVEEGMSSHDEKCILANDMYIERIVGYIAKYYVKLEGKVDALVFTAGLGENAREFRENILEKLTALNIYIDKEENMKIARFLLALNFRFHLHDKNWEHRDKLIKNCEVFDCLLYQNGGNVIRKK